MVIAAVKERDKEVCCMCGYDFKAAHRDYISRCYENNHHPKSGYAMEKMKFPKKIEYDHIVPFSEGGLTVLENMRSLCSDCHKQRTKKWHKERKTSKVDNQFLL